MIQRGEYGRRNGTPWHGILPSNVMEALIGAGREIIPAEPMTPGQIQPASIDLSGVHAPGGCAPDFCPATSSKRAKEGWLRVFMHEID